MVNQCGKREGKQIPVTQVENQVRDGVQQGDILRQQGLEGMAQIKRIKLINTRNERARVEARYGRNDVLVKQLDQKMATAHSQLVQARAERDRLIVREQLIRKDNQWSLHGYVRDADGFAMKKQTVGLYLNDQASDKPVAVTNTDSNGYYKFEQPMKAQIDMATNVRKPLPIQTLYVAVQDKNNEVMHVECVPVHPAAGGLSYRDIKLDIVSRTGRDNFPTQFLGNSGTREVHDLNNEKKNCHIDWIRTDHRLYFQSTKLAEKAGYDYCAHCFGKEKSRR